MTSVLAAALFFVFFGPTAFANDVTEISQVPLFTVQRTENANELHYEARLTPTGFSPKEPIEIYWVMKAKDGHREKLTAIEKQKAYGVAVEKNSEAEVVFRLRAFKGRKITARRTVNAGSFSAKAFTTINDEENELDRLFIANVPGSGLIPKVDRIEIFSRPKANGSIEKEILVP